MGQNPSVSASSYSGTSGDLSQVQTRLQAQLNILRSLARVSHKEVLDCIAELNAVTRTFTDRSGKQLRFMVRKGTDTTFLWKATIRIACLKTNSTASTVESARLLTLRQFVVIYKEITEQVAALSRPVQRLDEVEAAREGQGHHGQSSSPCKLDEFTAAAYFPSSSSKAGTGEGEDVGKTSKDLDQMDILTECCVCMDRKACLMLSCCHEFCEICIDNWTRDESHSTCPLCRTKVEGSDDTWVLTDEQDPRDYEKEVKGYLVGLADRTGRADNSTTVHEEEERAERRLESSTAGE